MASKPTRPSQQESRAALVVPCEVRRGVGNAVPGFAVGNPFFRRAQPASPASIYVVTDGDKCGESIISAAAISRFSLSIPDHSCGRVGVAGVPYRGLRLCLTMASARKDLDKRYPVKANGGTGYFVPAAVFTFMAK